MGHDLIVIIILIILDTRVLALHLMVVVDMEGIASRKVLRVVYFSSSIIRVKKVLRGLLLLQIGGSLMI